MKHKKSSAGVIVAAVATIILLAGITIDPVMSSLTAIAGSLSDDVGITAAATTTTTNANNTQHRIAVGGGNLSIALNQFLPSTINIQPGESVTFYAPSGSTELHNVVLDLSGGTAISSIELAFILPSGVSPEALQLAPPDNFGEPIIQNMSDGRQSIIALNKVLFHPSAVSQNGDATFLQEHELIQLMEQGAQQGLFLTPSLSANYTIQGTEVVVSSGLILDVMGFGPLLEQAAQEQVGGEGQQQQQQQQQQEPTFGEVEEFPLPAYPILSDFTVTFEEPGAYPFFCAFHPGMVGVVNVLEGDATQNQTGTEETLQTGTAQ